MVEEDLNDEDLIRLDEVDEDPVREGRQSLVRHPGLPRPTDDAQEPLVQGCVLQPLEPVQQENKNEKENEKGKVTELPDSSTSVISSTRLTGVPVRLWVRSFRVTPGSSPPIRFPSSSAHLPSEQSVPTPTQELGDRRTRDDPPTRPEPPSGGQPTYVFSRPRTWLNGSVP